MACVVDSSVALAWVLPDERSAAADRVLQTIAAERATAPALWLLEIANLLLIAERRNRITAAERSLALRTLGELPIVIEPIARDRVWRDAFQLAAAHGLTVYDALYLEAAVRLALPLASLDRPLARAAAACGVAVLGA